MEVEQPQPQQEQPPPKSDLLQQHLIIASHCWRLSWSLMLLSVGGCSDHDALMHCRTSDYDDGFSVPPSLQQSLLQ